MNCKKGTRGNIRREFGKSWNTKEKKQRQRRKKQQVKRKSTVVDGGVGGGVRRKEGRSKEETRIRLPAKVTKDNLQNAMVEHCVYFFNKTVIQYVAKLLFLLRG